MAALLALRDAAAEEQVRALLGHAWAVHLTADCEIEGWLATVVESEVALEVSPSHAEVLAECGGLAPRRLALPRAEPR